MGMGQTSDWVDLSSGDFTPAANTRHHPDIDDADDRGWSSTRTKLLWLSSLRLITMLVLVTASAILVGDTTGSVLDTVQTTLMWVGLIAAVPSALYFPFLLTARSNRPLNVIAVMQMIQDAIFATTMITVTGGSGSAFTFFYSLNIVVAGIVLGRGGTLISIAISFLMLLGVAQFELGNFAMPSFLDGVLNRSSFNDVLYSVVLNSAAFVGIGVLSSYLAEQLRKSDIEREGYRTTLVDLKQLHESVLASVETGIVSCRLDHRILHVNRAAQSLLNLEIARVQGMHLFDVVPEFRAPMEREPAEDFELKSMSDGVEKWLRVSTSPLIAKSGEMIGRIISVQNVTAIKQLQAKMKAEERLATLGKLSSVVAHEIRNPLAAMSASAQMIKMAGNLQPDDEQALEIVVREIDRLNEWITDLLYFARPKVGQIRDIDLRSVISNMISLLSSLVNLEGYEIVSLVEPGLFVKGDPDRMHRAFMNLTKNSLEAMSKGGVLKIISNTYIEDSQPWVDITFEDDGCGIPPEEIDRILDVFYTTKPRGTGLGLATVAQVAKEVQGHISVKSKPGVGTSFTIKMPLIEAN
ncbi:MAG TPA: ATP-binding protein [Myxococcota bacterium]|nr:ATP-binding protein [Myxococcota bacterium]HON25909.1 ATP-binding protein [Myxococcota bacterium]HOS62485.1 ATP-binding protein [Myxococcota bacterium]HPC92561.1 ATP-binding protein [Myxococcota bacterium]HPL26045.1 ATP-binding protein [Myxococcota bacterium]